MLRFWRSFFTGTQEDRQLLWSGVTQLASAAALVALQFGTDFKVMGFGPPWFDRIASFVVFTLTMYGVVMGLIIVVHAFTSVVVLRLPQKEIMNSFKFVATTAFILLPVCSCYHNANHHHSGVERLGSRFDEARLYVHLYPEAQKVMSYRVPAMISAEAGEYWLWSAFMPKGVRMDFDDCRVELQKTVTCSDTSGRRWGVVLTPTPAVGPP